MLRSLIVLCLVLFVGLCPVLAVTVTGHAYLYGQTSHGGIRVLFDQVSPSARTDSTFTDPAGNFQISLQAGVYNVVYSHAEFASYAVPNQLLLFDTPMPEVTLYPPLSGALSGTIGPGEFQVTDTITVDSGQTLAVLGGTTLRFSPKGWILVHGGFVASGSEGDSVIFTRRVDDPDSAWGGIRIIEADATCRLAYCRVDGGRSWYDSHYEFAEYGGGVLIDSSAVSISNCEFSQNLAYYGGAVSVLSESTRQKVVVRNCSFYDNLASQGGAVWFGDCAGDSAAYVQACTFIGNRAYGEGGGLAAYQSDVIVVDTKVSDNHATDGSGMLFDRSRVVLQRCRIDSNRTVTEEGYYGSIHFKYCTSAAMNECVSTGNASWFGAALYVEGTDVTVTRCSFIGNHAIQGSGLYCYGSCDIALNSSIVAYGDTSAGLPVFRPYAGAVFLGDSTRIELAYSDLFENLYGNFAFDNDTTSPPGIGIIALTNSRGDSCDTYYNIYRDPQFVDTTNGDYHLQSTSPCIDAGDPGLPRDPDGTIADMGAFYYPHLVSAPHREGTEPRTFTLHQNYPNPFNAQTRISFDLPRSSPASVEVFDLVGRSVKRVELGWVNAGAHEISFDGADLASGVYFYRLNAGAATATRKMVLLK